MMRFLILEDHPFMRHILKNELSIISRDCHVLCTHSLDMALEMIKKFHFDMIFIDPGLPGFNPLKLEGRLAVIRHMVTASPTSAHCVLTGIESPDPTEISISQELGIRNYISKAALDRERLSHIIKRITLKEFALYLEPVQTVSPDFSFPFHSAREQQIANKAAQNIASKTLTQICDETSDEWGIQSDSILKMLKSARKKIFENGYQSLIDLRKRKK